MPNTMETVETPWTSLVLICSKCGHKLKKSDAEENIAEALKGSLKSELREAGFSHKVRAANSSCLDICPEGKLAFVITTAGKNPSCKAYTSSPHTSAKEIIAELVK